MPPCTEMHKGCSDGALTHPDLWHFLKMCCIKKWASVLIVLSGERVWQQEHPQHTESSQMDLASLCLQQPKNIWTRPNPNYWFKLHWHIPTGLDVKIISYTNKHLKESRWMCKLCWQPARTEPKKSSHGARACVHLRWNHQDPVKTEARANLCYRKHNIFPLWQNKALWPGNSKRSLRGGEVRRGICAALQGLNKPRWTAPHICMHHSPKTFAVLLSSTHVSADSCFCHSHIRILHVKNP